VTITGTGLYGTTALTFGTTAAKSVTVTSPTQVKAVTKPHVVGTVTVKATTSGGTATASSDYTFVAPAPTITSFTPTSGTTSGTTSVTITGTGLYGATAVKFGTTTAKGFTVTSPTQIKAVTKPHVAGTVTVKATTAGGTATASANYTFVALTPTITSFTPATGTTSGTTTVTITGTGLYGATAVKFGTTTAKSFTVTSPTQIKAVTKPHVAATVAVKAITAGGTATASTNYTFVAPTPTITSFTPATGTTSGTTTVTITGTGLYGTTAVKFGVTTALSFTVTSPTEIKAVTKPHVASAVTVKATTAGGTATASTNYTFVAPTPTITSFTPATGTTSGTTTVTITGTGLYGATAVKFGATTAKSFTVMSPTEIKAFTKPHVTGMVTVKTITAGGTATAFSDYKFVAPTPSITSFTPATGTTSGTTTVAITGTGLYGATAVKFGTTTAKSFTVTSPTQIKAATEPHAAGTVTIKATTAGGTATSPTDYKFFGSSTNECNGLVPGKDAHEEALLGFQPTVAPQVTSVMAGSTAAVLFLDEESTPTSPQLCVLDATGERSLVSMSLTAVNYYGAGKSDPFLSGITAATEAGGSGPNADDPPTPGSYCNTAYTPPSTFPGPGTDPPVSCNAEVRLAFRVPETNPSDNTSPVQSMTIAVWDHEDDLDVYTWNVSHAANGDTPPWLTSIVPSAGPVAGADHVLLAGRNFTSGARATFGASSATTIVTLSSSLLTVVPPAHQEGIVTVIVTTAAGSSQRGLQYTYDPIPTLTSVSPKKGSTLGGNVVTLTGTGFASGSTVGFVGATETRISTAGQTVVVLSSTEIQVIAPPHSTGPVTIVVTTPGGTSASGTTATKYTFVTPPVLTRVTPNAGSTAGGNTVTLTGSKFTSGATVSFGSTAATVLSVTSATKMKVKAPAHATSTVTITVTTPTGTSDAVPYAFGAPTVSSVTPGGGALTGGTTITLKGGQFVSGATVSFGGASGTSVTVLSATKLTVRAPARATTGAVTVTVTTPAGTSTGIHYTYYPVPTLTSITPTGGKRTGGYTITLTGTQFIGGASVNFGSTPGTTVMVVSSTQIEVIVPNHTGAGVVTVVVKTLGGTSSGVAFTYYPAPLITTVTPSSGPVSGGQTVTITGSGLATTTKVSFGSTTATSFHIVNTVKITAVAPAHAAGSVTLIAATFGGTTQVGVRYAYDPVPTLTSAAPNGGSAGGGTTVVLTGTNFASTATVSFGGAAGAGVVVTSATKITVTSPAHGAGVVTVTVTTPGGTTAAFKYVFGPPAVTKITKGAGKTTGGTTVTITGTGFISGATVKFGTATGTTVTVTSSTTMNLKIPAHAGGTVTVVVHTAGGTSAPVKFFYGAPTLTKVTPSSGSTFGGTSITLTGTQFATGSTVSFGATAATTVVVASSTSITLRLPAHAAGAVTVKVTTGGGPSNTVSFTYSTASILTSLSPGAGTVTGGTTVTLVGTVFLPGATVSFGGTAGTVVSQTGTTKIRVTTPAHVAGAVTVTVHTSGGTSNGLPFVFGPPVLSVITPSAGKKAGGTSVTISGTGFATGATVSFGGTAATTVVVVSSTSITAKAPAHSAVGTISVTVTTKGGTSNSLTYIYDPVPTLSSLTPTSGKVPGGTLVTLTGTGIAGPATVAFGGKSATTVVVVSTTKITLKTPSHTKGTVTVTVTTPGGTSNSATFKYVVPMPTVTNFTPKTGSITGGATVTITGTNFKGTGFTATAVKFGATAATSYTVTSPTTIKAVPPAHVAGTVKVSVTNTAGTGTLTTPQYKYVIPAPTITSFTPETGLTSGATTITITGTSFSGQTISLSSIKFGTTTAASYTVTNSTTIKAVTRAHAPGTVTISVATNGGAVNSPTKLKFFTPITTTTVLASSGDPSQIGATVTFTATVSAKAPTTGTPSTGSVAFYKTGTLITCLSGSTTYSAGTATCKVKLTTASAGYSITAKFTSTDRRYKSSTSTPLDQVVDAAPTTTNISGTHTETTTTATSTSFTSVSGASYIIFADHTSSSGDSATLASTGSLATIHQVTVATNSIAVSGANAGTEPSWQWAWYATGTGSAGTATVTFAKASTKAGIPYNLIQIVKVTGVSPTNPVAGATLTDGKTASKKAVITLSSPSTSQQLVNLYVGGDMGGTAPAWSPTTPTLTNISGAFQHTGGGTTGDGETTALAAPGLSTATAGSTPGGWSATNTTAYGAVDLQLGLALPTPTISSISPTSGTTTGSTSVTIHGTNFSGATIAVTSVKFGTKIAKSFTVTSATKITAVSPTHVGGAVTLKVTTNGGSASATYTYTSPVPTLSTFSPTTGPTTGGTSVTITGTGFIGSHVRFGTTTATTIIVTSPTRITAKAPVHAAGTVSISVVNTHGDIGTRTSPKFTYKIPSPTISSFTPTAGATTGGTTITINGTNFSGQTISLISVKVGTTTAASYTVTNPTTINAVTKAHVAGTVMISVTTSGGAANSSAKFKFH
jgi:hypothetical protein